MGSAFFRDSTGGASGAIASAVGAQIDIAGRRYINFGGSSYLGLSGNAEIIDAGVAALRQWGAGTPVPRSQPVVSPAHLQVEAEAAAFFGTESALFMATGYLFGAIAIAGIRDRFSVILFDEFSHYALREAIAASGLSSHPFRHLDGEDLLEKMSRHVRASEVPLIVTDGLFPAMGEMAPLDALANAAQLFGGSLLIDESHSFGVIGPSGRGVLEQYGTSPELAIVGGSLGKAFGTCGGIIPASETAVAEFRCTPAGVGSSGGMPAAASMCGRSIRYVREHPELLKRLRENVAHMKSGLQRIGLQVGSSVAPIAAFAAGTGDSMQLLRGDLMAHGICVHYTNYLGAGEAGVIRCGIFADHTIDQINYLLSTLRRLL